MARSASLTAPPNLAKTAEEDADSDDSDSAVFLKQNGQIYMVRDFDTLKRWIEERRVDRHDLVSEGGVRWEPIGSRSDLRPHFSSIEPANPSPELIKRHATPEPAPEVVVEDAPVLHEAPISAPAAELVETPAPVPIKIEGSIPRPSTPSVESPFTFGGETPFGGAQSPSLGWNDDDTEGIPTGLPPLPTEELIDQGAFDEPDGGRYDLTRDRAEDQPSLDEPAPPAMLDEEYPDTPFEPFEIMDDDPMDAPEPSEIDEQPVELTADDEDWGHEILVPNPPYDASAYRDEALGEFVSHADEEEEDEDEDEDEGDFDEEDRDFMASDEEDFDDEWELPRGSVTQYRSQRKMYGAIFLTLIVLAAITWAMWPDPPVETPEPSQSTTTSEPPDLRSAPTPKPPTEPVEDPSVDEAPSVDEEQEVSPAEPVPAAPQPAAQPPPRPQVQPAPSTPTPTPPTRPAAPKKPTLSSLIADGWKKADKDPAEALQLFKQALAISSSNSEANLGAGYILKEQGNLTAAKKHLCKAAKSPDNDTVREALGMLADSNLSCP